MECWFKTATRIPQYPLCRLSDDGCNKSAGTTKFLPGDLGLALWVLLIATQYIRIDDRS